MKLFLGIFFLLLIVLSLTSISAYVSNSSNYGAYTEMAAGDLIQSNNYVSYIVVGEGGPFNVFLGASKEDGGSDANAPDVSFVSQSPAGTGTFSNFIIDNFGSLDFTTNNANITGVDTLFAQNISVQGNMGYTGSVTLSTTTQMDFTGGILTSYSTSYDNRLIKNVVYPTGLNCSTSLCSATFQFNDEGLKQFPNRTQWQNVNRVGYIPQDVAKFYPQCTISETEYKYDRVKVPYNYTVKDNRLVEVARKDAYEKVNVSQTYGLTSVWNGTSQVKVDKTKSSIPVERLKNGFIFNATTEKFYESKQVDKVITSTKDETVKSVLGTYLTYNKDCVQSALQNDNINKLSALKTAEDYIKCDKDCTLQFKDTDKFLAYMGCKAKC